MTTFSPSAYLRRKKNRILQRCLSDEPTKARLKYQPWYHHIDRQEGARVWINGRELVMMSSNDYLGLSFHPKVKEAAQEAISKWGSSTTGARLANGSRSCHRELERKLAHFLGKDDSMVFSAGYLACMASVSTFAQKGDLILVDRNVHSSLWTGIQSTMADVERFAHNSASDLQDILMTEDRSRPKMIVLEGVYSMEGHIAPLQEIVEVSRSSNPFIVVDDAHGLGVLGDRGQGTVGYLDRTSDVDIICGSLSKAMASIGGFVAGDRAVIEYLKTTSKQAIFSAAIAPAQAASALTSLKLLKQEPEHRERLWDNTRYYKRLLNQLDVDTWDSKTPAVPIIIGNKERTYRVWKQLMEEGMFTVMAIPPAVSPGKDLLRTAVSASHTREDLERFVECLKKALNKD